MPKIQSHTVIDITPEKFLNACDSTELHEVELLLSSPRYRDRMDKWDSGDSSEDFLELPVVDPVYLESGQTGDREEITSPHGTTFKKGAKVSSYGDKSTFGYIDSWDSSEECWKVKRECGGYSWWPDDEPVLFDAGEESELPMAGPIPQELLDSFPEKEVRSCHQCGCTDDDCRQCIEKTGEPCHWVAEDLCSACAENAEPSKMSKLDGVIDSEGLLIEFAKHLRKAHLLHAHDVTLEGEVGFFLKNIKDKSPEYAEQKKESHDI